MQSENELIDTIKNDISVKFKIPFDGDVVGTSTNLIEAGMLDSFGMVEMICYLEDTFQVKLTDDDLVSPDITSVSGMANLVQKRRAA